MKKNSIFLVTAWVCCAALFPSAVQAKPTPSPLFGDHAVLQRNRPVPVWGLAEPGEVVSVSFAGASQPLDGVDLVPYFTGKKSGEPHEMLFWRMSERNIWAVREGDHKLVQQFGKRGFFDLSSDIGESKNLDGKLPEVQDRLQKAHDAWSTTLLKPLWTVYGNDGSKAKKHGKTDNTGKK